MAGGMGAGSIVGMGEGALGGTLGAIGDIISAASYQRPKLKPATGMELRLRQLAQDQLLGGGQEQLAGTALYNQMVPILMGMLPGMHYVPGTGGDGGGGGGAAGSGGSAGNYSSALSNYQSAMGQQNQLNQLKAQRKGAGKGQKQPITQQIKALKKQIKGTQPVNQLERQAYMAGTQPGAFDIRQGAPPSFQDAIQSGLQPSGQTSLGDINTLLAQYNQGPDLSSLYQQGSPGGY